MSRAASNGSPVVSAFERRAARAESLLRTAPAAEEFLRFAAGLNRAQGRVAAAAESLHAAQPLSGRLVEDAERFQDQAGVVLRFAAENGPSPLSDEAAARLQDERATGRSRLLVSWESSRTTPEDYLSRAILRPYVEVLRSLAVAPDRLHRQGHCPFCGGAPGIAARREGSLMEGAKRVLVCALCGGEWPFGRILCPSCLEENPQRLPSFSREGHTAVRIEACETCRRYVKSIDLSEDARPIPEIDDLVSISLDLWAADQGFERIEPGLAGV